MSKYLQLLYQELEKEEILCAREELDLEEANFILEDKIHSPHSVFIKDKTEEVINRSQELISIEEIEEYQKVTEHYIQSLEKLLLTREELLAVVLMRAGKAVGKVLPSSEKENVENFEEIIKELKESEQYREELKPYVKEEVKKLKEKERKVLMMGYKKKK